MKGALRLLAGLLFAGSSCAMQEPGPPSPDVGADRERRPDKVLRVDDWELRVWYRAKGSRSEGQHGVLLHQGEVVAGQPGEEVTTPLGRMRCYGDTPEQLWRPSGWNFADPTLITPSGR